MIVGRRERSIASSAIPLKRALRCDKLTLAALSATMRLYLRSGDLVAMLPTLRFLSRSRAMKQIAPRARDILADRLGADFQSEIMTSTSQIGSGALPTEELPTVAIRVTHPRLRRSDRRDVPPRASAIIGRIADDAFQLDLRTIDDPAVFAATFPPRGRSARLLCARPARALQHHQTSACRGENPMPDKTYKIVEVVGVSDESIHQAVRNALTKASQTLRNHRLVRGQKYTRLSRTPRASRSFRSTCGSDSVSKATRSKSRDPTSIAATDAPVKWPGSGVGAYLARTRPRRWAQDRMREVNG